MRAIVPFSKSHLDQLASLVNIHVGSVVPGWALPVPVLAARLERDPGEFVVDPWVVERRTLVAIEHDRVVAAAHLHRYGDHQRVGPAHRDASEIVWLVAWPTATDAASELLAAALRQLDLWHAPEPWAFDGSLYVPTVCGIPDAWPHLARLARAAGLTPDPERTETLHAGYIADVEPPPAPLADLTLRRTVADNATQFSAWRDDVQVGLFDVAALDGSAISCLAGWAEPWNLWVKEDYRSQGIGTWLVRSASRWLRLGGCDRLVVTVDAEGMRNGAGRFYERLGWSPIATLERAWSRENRDHR